MKKIKKYTQTSYFTYLVLIAMILLGFAVRMYKYSSPIADWHSWRQAGVASVSDIFLKDGLDVLHPKYYDISTSQTGYYNPNGYWFVELPIFSVIHFFLVKYLSLDFILAGRLISIVASLVSAFYIFKIARKFIGNMGGLLAAFFFLFLPFNIYYSRTLLPEPLAVCFALAGIWYFVDYLDKERTYKLFLSAILFALSFLTKPFTVFYMFPVAYLTYENISNKKLLKNLWWYGLISLGPLALWRLWIKQFPEGIPHTKWAFNGDGIRFRPAFWRWIFGERLGKLILGVWGLIPFSFAFLTKGKEKWFVYSFLFGSMAFVSIFATANVRHDYYQIVAIPSLCIAMAYGIIGIYKSEITNKLTVLSISGFSVFMMLGMGWYQVKEYYKVNHPEIVVAGEAVDKLIPKNAKVIAPYNKDMAFLYQTHRYGWTFIDGSLDDQIEKGAEYYVSVNFDDLTVKLMNEYQIVALADNYVVVDLKHRM